MTVPLYRGDELLELDVKYAKYKNDSGFSYCLVKNVQIYSKSERAWIEIQLNDNEYIKIEDFIEENWEE